MPWRGDQFEYTRGYVQLLIETFFEKREEAYAPSEDPARPLAMPYYDMLRALSECAFTQKQWRALRLRLEGRTHWEIGHMLGVSRQAIGKRLHLAENKIKRYLVGYGRQTPHPEGK